MGSKRWREWSRLTEKTHSPHRKEVCSVCREGTLSTHIMSNFGELVLLVGDHHIPMRAVSIPSPFLKMLIPGKMQHVLCTGNIGDLEEYERLKGLVVSGSSNMGIAGGGGASGGNVHCVQGEYDFASGDPNRIPISFPETKIVTVGMFTIGIIGGHQIVPWGDLTSLAMQRRKLNVDILVCGHRRKCGIEEYDGGYYLFPGSITGAYSIDDPTSEGANPSFILLAVQGDKIVCYVYELKNGEVDVSKIEFSKKAEDIFD